MKLSRKPPVRELYSILVPKTQWNTLSIDFIVELPKFSRYDTVMMVVDSISKQAHFIPMHTMVTAEGAARLFFYNMWKLHRLPQCVISDHGPQFVALFTKELY